MLAWRLPMAPDPSSSEALAQLVARTPVAMLVVDTAGVIRQANAQAEALFGWTASELQGSAVEILVPGPLRQHHAERRANYNATPHARSMGQSSRLEARHRDGHLFPVDVMLAPLEAGLTLAVVVDRSELRVAEEALRQSAATFHHVMENVQDIVYVVKTRGGNPHAAHLEALSDHVERVIGWSVEEFIRDPELWYRSVHPDDVAELSRATQQLFETRQAVVRHYRLRHKHTGEWRWFEDRAALLCDARGAPNGYSGVARDVTEAQAAQARAVMNERLAALGLLAAGVSHELSNPLTYVLASVDHAAALLRDKPEELARAREALADALDGVGRMRDILADLSQISREEQRSEPRLVDVRRAADLAVRIASAAVADRASIERDYVEVPPVRGDETRLAQLFLNLLLNAAHAIPSERHGRIVIHVHAGEGGQVVASVEDDGEGIAPETLPRLFEPFFTTKPAGVGTGLGLYVCRTIAREMGGDVEVESERGRGTRVRVVLPAVLV